MSASTKDLLALTEGILSETPSVEKVAVPNHKGRLVPDDGLKDVMVPNAFVDQIVGFNGALNESSDPDKKQEMMPDFEPITESTILKERLETLVESLKQLLKEARNVMEEMTTTGMIGVNLAPVKKNGSRKRNKRNKSN
tara:strand:- start:1 stop:417 length:417 start_codon:yes stop_codon:yes gene_type:complete